MTLQAETTTQKRSRRRIAAIVGGVILIATVATSVWLAFGTPDQTERAEEALRRHDPVTALGTLREYLAEQPEDGDGLLLAARAARLSDAYADAERYLTDHDRAHGPSARSKLEWALLGAQQGDFTGDESRLLAADSPYRSETPDILYALARGYDVIARRSVARGILERLIDRHPDHLPARILLGKIATESGDFDAAERHLHRAVELAPGSVPGRAALADLLNRQGHSRGAIELYLAIRQTAPHDSGMVLGLARAYADEAKPREAQRVLDEFLGEHPENPEVLTERARVAIRAAEPAEGASFLRQVLDADPWHRDAQVLLLVASEQLGQDAEVKRCEEHLAKLRVEEAFGKKLEMRALNTPKDLVVRWQLWRWCDRTGRHQEGFVWLAQMLGIEPAHPQAHQALAAYFAREGQPRRAAYHRDLARTQ